MKTKKKKGTDFIWSKNTYGLDLVIEDSGNRVLYCLQDEPKRTFERKELIHITEIVKYLLSGEVNGKL